MKAVFFDIDNTLWDEKFVIPDSVKTAIDGLHKKGHLAFICSGRTRCNIRDPRLLALGFDGILAGCGTYIEKDGKVIFEYKMEQDLIRRLFGLMLEEGMKVLMEGSKYMYADFAAFVGNDYIDYIQDTVGDCLLPTAGNEGSYDISKMSAEIAGGDVERLRRELGEEIDVIQHDPNIMEVVPKGYNKATGIAHVCQLLGIRQEDTLAFGDSVNDLDMLRYVGCGIAMGNGMEAAKEAADYVTDSVREDGIYNALVKLAVIDR